MEQERREIRILATLGLLVILAYAFMLTGCTNDGPTAPSALVGPSPAPTPDPECAQAGAVGWAFLDDDGAARPTFQVHVGTFFWMRGRPVNAAGTILDPIKCSYPKTGTWLAAGSAACTPLGPLRALDVPFVCWAVGGETFLFEHNGKTATWGLLVNP